MGLFPDSIGGKSSPAPLRQPSSDMLPTSSPANVTDIIIPKFGFCSALFFSSSVAFCNVALSCRGCKVILCPRNPDVRLRKHAASSVAASGQRLHPQWTRLDTWVIVSVVTATFVCHSVKSHCLQFVGSLMSSTEHFSQFERSKKMLPTIARWWFSCRLKHLLWRLMCCSRFHRLSLWRGLKREPTPPAQLPPPLAAPPPPPQQQVSLPHSNVPSS